MSKMIAMFVMMLNMNALAHEGHHHGDHSAKAKENPIKPDINAAYLEIQKDYLNKIKPIFDLKCAACHSVESEAPWYASIPLVGWVVHSDRNEAKEHLETSKGFPFAGHGTPEEDLAAIKDTVSKEKMPTNLYVAFHPSSRLTDQEKAATLLWVERSQKIINGLVPTKKSH